uniref:TrbK n=1 Tax=Comamonas testosteroni TaxID=285 RepID=G9C9C9_COMTE|nr:TrbK [Comamonas testosteroni]
MPRTANPRTSPSSIRACKRRFHRSACGPARSNLANLSPGEVLTNENASQLETRPAAARLAGVLFYGRFRPNEQLGPLR